MTTLQKPAIDSLAPLFTLQDQNGDQISLADFRGKTVVVYFYPKAMTPGCTTQACGIRDSQAPYAAQNIVVLAISPDPSNRLKKFEEKQNLNFSLLSDPDHAVADRYGVWGLKKFMGREFDGIHRSTFIIGADGHLKHIIAKVNTKTHHEDVLNWIKAHL
ncbi:thioredoxin-dependent thiol peroxidase [bacterium (Candidatus Blackallbacteria) CG17_big_fil_post_rev_8_21_14_2_50_48_46]|uniref:thioredoxin-dependent peroxiredoxin n=1 Tax=bacterium (Candidatus Blackallbacteria) CG17_big_fil_post_rev_8_21_14_2_50_48_46 TaxID=2014261 RepID=A0A2M7FZL4_9BACT|nr:MAG: thioredoxin-dependent thiol peroxidase [bacterium (Candidatus Blackallbacteria) CG18_big_fil_WC_8_21_14_2_50_49_26]PIW14851.1 MAG: thioredoxin-dependent thiol peroxidase [bacterium (Candidatus Blackallbacteria) CG17_big_fil_post_rev_8_21_14_2_50_48_46]PIW44418.1 MAG: thioredoxin-dependent thiol peroxidase [bacterium (Candidatus Blackallbacteria) CG13_big_fil_rev_8_21_14_2_50_49_14]